jgi:trimethylamine---corrinoid protein Co-methyltransferase
MVRQRRRKGKEQKHGATSESLVCRNPDVFAGGCFHPLSNAGITQITDNAFSILERIGLGGAPDWLRKQFEEQGAQPRPDGRITFPRGLVEDAIARASHNVDLPGFHGSRNLKIGGGNVHIGTAGAAVQVLDAGTGGYRDSTLADLYNMMRVLDVCPNVHYGVRPLVARDMATPLELDINTAYACVRGTTKPVGISFHAADHVEPVTQLFDLALEREDSFRNQPFCMAIVVHVVPPLQFAEEGMEIMRAAIAAGMPLQICSAGQAGATSPASLAGALAQGLAESLAGMMVVDALKPGHPCIYAFMPFISDLRTGAFAGGGGEAAIASAAAAQLLLHLNLPSTACAGMTDSKIADAQAGYEKGYTVALAAQAGADMINLSVGMLGSIMVASPEALAIDDEMCGAILRSVRGIEVNAELLDLEAMERVVTGEGHYLGEAQTLGLMKTEYVYPALADRLSVDEWIEQGSQSIWDKACERVTEILNSDHPDHISRAADQMIRDRFPIRLDLGG